MLYNFHEIKEMRVIQALQNRTRHIFLSQFFFYVTSQMVKNLPAVQESQVQSLGWENPLEKGMAIHFSIFAWRIPWTEKPGGLQSMGSQTVGHD